MQAVGFNRIVLSGQHKVRTVVATDDTVNQRRVGFCVPGQDDCLIDDGKGKHRSVSVRGDQHDIPVVCLGAAPGSRIAEGIKPVPVLSGFFLRQYRGQPRYQQGQQNGKQFFHVLSSSLNMVFR